MAVTELFSSVDRGENFCNAPFNGIYVDTQGHVRICAAMCAQFHSLGNLNDMTFDEIVEGEPMRKIHEAFESGSYPDFCGECIRESAKDYNGLRNYYNQIPRENKFTLKTLWLTLSNQCQFSCRMCTDWASTGRFKLLDKIDVVTTTDRAVDGFYAPYTSSDNVFKMIEDRVMEMERVNFNGGDPALDKHFIRCLELLVKNPKIMIVIHLSGATLSTSRMEKIANLLNQFENVILEFSIDGVGELNDYIRVGTDFESVMKSFYTWREKVPHAVCNIHPAISNLNAKYMGDLAYYFMTEHPELVKIFINCKVERPYEMQPSNMPLEQREEAKRYLVESMRKIVKLPSSETKSTAMRLCSTALYAIDAREFDEELYAKFLHIEKRTNEVIDGKRKKCSKGGSD